MTCTMTRVVADPRHEAACDDLVGVLSRLCDGTYAVHARRSSHMAVAFVRADNGLVGEAAVTLGEIRMIVAGGRFCEGNQGGIRARVPVAKYRPVLDTATGRVTWDVEDVSDAAARQGCREIPNFNPRTRRAATAVALRLVEKIDDVTPATVVGRLKLLKLHAAFRSRSSPIFESTHSPEAWASAEFRIGNMRAWPLAMFARPFGARFAVNPLTGLPSPADGGPEAGWALRDDGWQPVMQAPDAVYAYLPGFEGKDDKGDNKDEDGCPCKARNPAFVVLQRHKVIAATTSYFEWMSTVARKVDGDWEVYDPRDDNSPAGRFRRRLGDYATAIPSNLDNLIADLRAACRVRQIDVDGLDDDGMFKILDNPWEPVDVPGAAAIQVVSLTGPPSPETMTCVDATQVANLYDLGAAFDQVESRRVKEARDQVYARRRSGNRRTGNGRRNP